jgi:hypothetical protein
MKNIIINGYVFKASTAEIEIRIPIECQNDWETLSKTVSQGTEVPCRLTNSSVNILKIMSVSCRRDEPLSEATVRAIIDLNR